MKCTNECLSLVEHVESVEHHNDSPKNSTPITIFTVDHSNETPPPNKNRSMK